MAIDPDVLPLLDAINARLDGLDAKVATLEESLSEPILPEPEPEPTPDPEPEPEPEPTPEPSPLPVGAGVWTAQDEIDPHPAGKHTRMVYRLVDGRIYEIGGDYGVPGSPHPASGRQEMWSIKLGESTWTMVHDYCLGAGESQPERPDEAPTVYDSKRDVMWMATGSWTTNPCESTTLKGTWAYYDFADGKWHDTGIAHDKGASKRAVYDPVTDAIYGFTFHGGQGLQVRKFDIAAGVQEVWNVSYDDQGEYINNFRLFDTPIAIDPVGRVIYGVYMGTGHLFAYHIDLDTRLNGDGGNNPAFKVLLQDDRLIEVESGAGTEAEEGASGAEWDAANNVLLLFWAKAKGRITPFSYHPDTKMLESLPLDTDPPGLFPQGNSFVFDAANGLVLAIGHAFTTEETPSQDKIFWFRYAEAVADEPTEPEPTEPSVGELAFAPITPLESQRIIPFFKDDVATDALTQADAHTTLTPVWRAWSYPVYGDGKLWYMGGAHSDYAGNDVEVYDISANVWAQSYHPRVPPDGDPMYGGGGSPNVYQDGELWQPYTIHGYGRQSFDESTGEYVITATGLRPDGTLQHGVLGFKGTAWRYLNDTSRSPIGASNLSEYDESLGGILSFGGAGSNPYVWLVKNGVLTEMPTMPFKTSGAGHGGDSSVYVPELEQHLIARLPQGGRPTFQCWRVHFATGIGAQITVPQDALDLVGNGGNWLMAYSRAAKKALILQRGVDGKPLMRWYDPINDAWSAPWADPNGPEISDGAVSAGRKSLQYDRLNNRFLMLSNVVKLRTIQVGGRSNHLPSMWEIK